jgi:hypothetical protein
MTIKQWLADFRVGWRRRNEMILDNCGVPAWIICLRCPRLNGWGRYLQRAACLSGALRYHLRTALLDCAAQIDEVLEGA